MMNDYKEAIEIVDKIYCKVYDVRRGEKVVVYREDLRTIVEALLTLWDEVGVDYDRT